MSMDSSPSSSTTTTTTSSSSPSSSDNTVVNDIPPGLNDLFHHQHKDYLLQLHNDELHALKDMVDALKNDHSFAPDTPPQLLMPFLWTRKFDVAKAVHTFKSNLKLREYLKLSAVRVKITDVNEELLRRAHFYCIPKTQDKNGRFICYFIAHALLPSSFDPKDFLAVTMFFLDWGSFNFPPESHRLGMVVVEDTTNMGFKHIDMRLFKTIKEAGIEGDSMQDIFPGKIKGVLILNPPLIIKALFKIARLFMKKKLVQRVHIVTPSEIMKNWIEPDQLHTVFGGTVEYNHQKWVDEEIQRELRLETEKFSATTPKHSD